MNILQFILDCRDLSVQEIVEKIRQMKENGEFVG